MRKQGTIVRWEAARGFGFIRSPAASADVFFHLRDLRGGMQPREGMDVTFDEIHVGGKGPRAMAI
ncbi:MAG: cold shock domain-containing protein, partial [Polaromonas sp.]|nr:cold shock domain-containing protein [Polaromonas sp.]